MIMIMMNTTLIRPHLDYASVVWNPYQLGHIRAIEKIQRRANRIIPEFRGYSYFDRLKTLNLLSLVYRRRRMDMIMVYKIIYGLDGSPFDMFLCTMMYQQDLMVINYSRSFVILM